MPRKGGGGPKRIVFENNFFEHQIGASEYFPWLVSIASGLLSYHLPPYLVVNTRNDKLFNCIMRVVSGFETFVA